MSQSPFVDPLYHLQVAEGDFKVYHEQTIFVVGDAKASQNNPITKQFSQFFVALIVDVKHDEIVDSGCSSTLQVTERFIQSLFIGRNIKDNDIESDIRKRYIGSSQKALITAFREAKIKYEEAKSALTT